MRPFRWDGSTLEVLDQRLLPLEERYLLCHNAEETASAIAEMAVRGAPAIALAAAFGMAMEASRATLLPEPEFVHALAKADQRLRSSRPTAINLFHTLDGLVPLWQGEGSPSRRAREILEKAEADLAAEERTCQAIATEGSRLFPVPARVLTYCNTGALATGGIGTALGVIRQAWREGRLAQVYASETRPYLQGARLTAWELLREGIPTTLITDNTAGFLMQKGLVNLVIVGADRITAAGDTANKIGTYSLAVLARHHGVPFYVAAPVSSIDWQTTFGQEVPIEERPADEVRRFRGHPVAPPDVPVFNPAFDITPRHLITGIITEKGHILSPSPLTMDQFRGRILG